jgi:murein L,D-transpeptidase YafK
MQLFYVSLLFCSFLCCRKNSNAVSPYSHPAIREKVDSIVIIKHARQMEVYSRQKLLTTYRICLGNDPTGPKHFKNDGKTPEGIYHIDGKNPNSHYHKCLGISYPSVADILYAKKYGKPTGGDIKIHGLPNDFDDEGQDDVKDDWTLGCIALTDKEIDELYSHVSVGTLVNILP